MTRLTLIVDAFNAANAQRQLAGLSPLVWDQNLFNMAEVRSNEIVVLFEHTRPDGTECGTAAPGELYGESILKGNTNSVKTGAGAYSAYVRCGGEIMGIVDNDLIDKGERAILKVWRSR